MYRVLALLLSIFVTAIGGVASLYGTTSGVDSLYTTTGGKDSLSRYSLDTLVVRERVANGVSHSRRFSVGSRVERIDNSTLERLGNSSLSDLLVNHSSAYIKEYGRGMSSYLSVRGGSSSHTPISWNGVALTIPTLGQTNLSQVPLYFFDRLELHVGGSSLLYGDGAIGGKLELSTLPQFKGGVHGDFLLSGGSYSTLFGGANLRYGSEKSEGRSALFYNYSKNNFSFKNNTKMGHPRERLNNSSYNNGGFLQEFHHKFKNSSQLGVAIWYLNYQREIQPSVSLNDRPESYASLYDRSIKGVVTYQGGGEKLDYSFTTAYSNDYQLYKEDIIESDRISFLGEGQFSTEEWLIKGGASAEYIVPTGRSYDLNSEEWRGYLYTMARYEPRALSGLALSGGLRGGVVTNGELPLMPLLEVSYSPNRRGEHRSTSRQLTFRGSVSRSSRVPTLNDRYWGGTHNYLKSEDSFTLEGGVDLFLYTFKNENSLSLSATLYSSRVNNWIRWLPAGPVWRPQNVPLVSSQGVEVTALAKREFGILKSSLSFKYSYTSIKMVEGLWLEDPSKGHQLAFQPKHSFVSTIEGRVKGVTGRVQLLYTGERRTLDLFDLLKPYLLVDGGVDYEWELFGKRMVLSGEVKNISDVTYQNVKFYAMAGRNYQLALRIWF